jgi:hypothetical protein
VLGATLGCGRTPLDSSSQSLDEGGTAVMSCLEDAGMEDAGLQILYTEPTPPGAGAGATAIAVDTANIYWMTVSPINPDGAAGVIMKTSLCGQGTTVLASPPPTASLLNTLAVSNANLYWVAASYSMAPIMQTPLGGGPSTTFMSGQRPGSLAIDSTSLYWTDALAHTVVKALLDGGAPTPLSQALGFPQDLLAVDATGVYFWAAGQGVERLPLQGGDTTLLASDPDDRGLHLTVYGGNVYWSTLSNVDNVTATIMTVSVAGGTPTLLSSDPAFSFATDGANVYWTVSLCGAGMASSCTGAVRKVPVGGGTPTTVVSGWPVAGVSGVAVDATSVYWSSGNSVMKMTPK